MSYTSQDLLRFADLIENLCIRPAMYVGDNKFLSTANYLQGVSDGYTGKLPAPAGTPESAEPYPRGFMDDYADWFDKEHGPFGARGWQSLSATIAVKLNLSGPHECLSKEFRRFVDQKVSALEQLADCAPGRNDHEPT